MEENFDRFIILGDDIRLLQVARPGSVKRARSRGEIMLSVLHGTWERERTRLCVGLLQVQRSCPTSAYVYHQPVYAVAVVDVIWFVEGLDVPE